MGPGRSARPDRGRRRRLIPQLQRGDVRWLRFASPDKRRPVLVLGREPLLASWSQIPVIPLTSQIRGLPWEVRLSQEDGLAVVSVLKAEWIRSVERSLLGPLIARLRDDRWHEVRKAVLMALGLDE